MSIPQPANPQPSPSESPYPRRFHGRVVIITGAAGGIGRAAARRFAGEGAAIVAVDLPGSDLDGTAAVVEAGGGRVTAVTADVRSDSDVAGYVAAALDTHGKVDALFNNAGVEGPVVPLVDYPADDFDRVMAVNVRGVWLGLKHAGPAIAASGGGAIVNTASMAGVTGTARLCAYGASKHAVIGLTKTAALEFAPLGVRVNAVAPAPIDTRMLHAIAAGMNPDDPSVATAQMAARVPLARYGTPDEVAAVAAFLCSDDATYMTGAMVPVDGGWWAGG